MELLPAFLAYIKKENLFSKNDGLLLAVSGGVDSAVLCALCAQASFKFSLAHCNFKLRGAESDRDETFVKSLGIKYGVPVFTTSFDTATEAKIAKTSIEETARNLRYKWFQQLMDESKVTENSFSYLVTAHHADDNVETVMMNFFRGTGIKGLRGIKPKQQHIVRPLLFATRKEIDHFAELKEVAFITDSSNAANDYTRNLFRNEILPSIEKVYPEALKNVYKNIERFAELEIIYNESIAQLISKLVDKKGVEKHVPVLKLLKTKPLHTIIYEIIKDAGFNSLQVAEVEKLLHSESGKYMKSPSHIILRNRKWLIISPIVIHDEVTNLIVEEGSRPIKFNGNVLSFIQVDYPQNFTSEPSEAFIDREKIVYPMLLRKWKTGDYFYPLGMTKKKKLSRFFIDQKLSLLQKNSCWVLESDKRIVWVVGYRIDDRFKISPSSKHILKLSLTH